MSKVKLNKVEVQVESQVKVDNRVNNTGRPVNKKSIMDLIMIALICAIGFLGGMYVTTQIGDWLNKK